MIRHGRCSLQSVKASYHEGVIGVGRTDTRKERMKQRSQTYMRMLDVLVDYVQRRESRLYTPLLGIPQSVTPSHAHDNRKPLTLGYG